MAAGAIPRVKVVIDCCEMCGYESRGNALAAEVERQASASSGESAFEVVTDVDFAEPRSFEVTVDDVWMAHSKLSTGRFPESKVLAKEIAEYAVTKKVPEHWKRVKGT